ncbi:MAG: galactokinase [Lachnospiraceae bacterium]|nr:galactokinase [Lachnospiraceae bacterium]MBP5653327.1 galactokinase [Lachnospiraceae bacterium]
MKEKMIEGFKKVFGGDGDIRVFFAPGRVNLIGEHTDYNGGHVFPCALTIGTYAAVRKRNDRTLRFYSENFEEVGVIESSIDDLVNRPEEQWTRYAKGVIWAFKEHGFAADTGFDFYCKGTIPNGSGLSSSASLEILVAKVLIELFGFDTDMFNSAIYGQYAENKYVGVNCGIMDQFAIAMGKKDSAIFLDTATLKYEYVPVKLDGIRLVIGNTNKKRGLGDSKYNERRAECEHALSQIQTVCNAASWGALDEAGFEKCRSAITSPVEAKRAKHAVYENRRTIEAVEALGRNDIARFGELMNASHVSLRDDYEVTGKELDTLVEAAWEQPGVIGARMTGAGFGGCTVSMVRAEKVDDFIKNVGRIYAEKIGYDADFYVVDIGDGPVEL